MLKKFQKKFLFNDFFHFMTFTKSEEPSIDFLMKKLKRKKLGKIWEKFKNVKNMHKIYFSKFFTFPRSFNIFKQTLSIGQHRSFNLKNSVITNVLKVNNKELFSLKALVLPILIKKKNKNKNYFYKILSHIHSKNLLNLVGLLNNKLIIKNQLDLEEQFFIYFSNFFLTLNVNLCLNVNYFFSNFFSKFIFFNNTKIFRIGDKQFYFILKNFYLGFYNYLILNNVRRRTFKYTNPKISIEKTMKNDLKRGLDNFISKIH